MIMAEPSKEALEAAALMVKELTHRWCTLDPCPPDELDYYAAVILDAFAQQARDKALEEAAEVCAIMSSDIDSEFDHAYLKAADDAAKAISALKSTASGPSPRI
jgi:hypothetical protein